MIALEVVDAGVSRAFGDLGRRLENLRDVWQLVGAEAVDDATPFVPLKVGRLVESLKAEAGPAGVDVIAGSGSVVYAGVQDRGWPAHNIEGHQFMQAALDSMERNAPGEVENEIEALIRRVGLN